MTSIGRDNEEQALTAHPSASLPQAARRAALLACLRWDGQGDAALAALSETDWQDLGRLIVAGRGEALLARRLARTGGAVRPPETVALALKARQKVLVRRAFQTTTALVKAVDRAERPVMILKGLDLAHRVYGDFGVRFMCDADVLVRPEHYAALHAALVAEGFTTDTPPTPERHAHPLWSQASYSPPGRDAYPLDLHWRLGKREEGLDDEIDADAIWSRAVPYRGLGRDAFRVMAAEDLLLYLCLHIRHHTYDCPLTHIWDLAEVLEWSHGRFDWDVFWRRAEEWTLTQTVRLAFLQLSQTLGVAAPAGPLGPLPARAAEVLPDVLPNLGRHQNRNRVAEPHVAALFAPAVPRRERLRRLWGRLFPARSEIAARFGVPEGSWRVLPRYAVYWVGQSRLHGHFVLRWLAGDRGLRVQSNRVAALAYWLDDRRFQPRHEA